MEITEIKQIGKSENYRIFLDMSYALTLNIQTIYKNKLKSGLEITKEDLEKMQFESEKIIAFDLAVKLLSKSYKTTKEMKEYLAKKGYGNEICDYVTNKLKEYKYLNDNDYAKMYIESKKQSCGKQLLKKQLFLKGINKEIIDTELKGLSQDEEISNICTKYMKNKEKNQVNKQKLYRYLVSKGFAYSEIKKAVNNFFGESGSDDWN